MYRTPQSRVQLVFFSLAGCPTQSGETGNMADTPTDVTISEAPSARSKCQACKETILKGTQRVGFPGRHNGATPLHSRSEHCDADTTLTGVCACPGLTVTRWVHPVCFANECIMFDFAPTGRAKCSLSGREIAKGQLRLVMGITSCEGKMTSKKIFHPPAAASLTGELLALSDCRDVSVDALCASISDKVTRCWASDALRGVDVSSRTVPTCEAKAQPSQKKAKRKRSEPHDGSDDGELVD